MKAHVIWTGAGYLGHRNGNFVEEDVPFLDAQMFKVFAEAQEQCLDDEDIKTFKAKEPI